MTKLQVDYWKNKEQERHNKEEEWQHVMDRTGKVVVDVLNWGANIFNGVLRAIV